MQRLLTGLLVALAVSAATVLVVPSLIDWNAHKDAIAERASAVTGRPVRIGGEIDLALLPTPVLSAGAVRIGGGDADRARLDIGALDIRVSFLPLFRGDIRVERVILVDPVLHLESRDRTWPGLLSGVSDPARGLAGAVRLDRLTIQNGSVLWSSGAAGALRRIDHIFAQVRADSLAGPAEIVGSVAVRGVGLTVDLTTGRLSPTGTVPMRLGMGADGVDGELRFAGEADLAGRLRGELVAEGSDLAAVIRRFGLELPAPRLAARPFTVRASADAGASGAVLDTLMVDLGEVRAAGSLRAGWAGTPRIDLDLGAGRVDLDAWLGAGDPGAAASAPFEPAAPWRRLSIPTGLELAVDLSADAIRLRGELIRQARLSARTADGVLSVDTLSAQLPGSADAALSGTLRIDQGVPSVQAEAEAAASDLRRLLRWLAIDVSPVPNDRLRRFQGHARLSGTPASFQLTAVDVTVDATRITGGLAYLDRGRPGIGLRLGVDRLNLDAYRPPRPDPTAARTDPLPVLARQLRTALRDIDANLFVEVDRLTVAGVPVRGIRLDATVHGGSVLVRDATIEDLAGASIRIGGTAASLQPLDALDVTADLSAPSAAALFRLLDLAGPLPPERLGALSVSGRARGGRDALSLALEAEAAGGRLSLGGDIIRPFDEPAFDLALRVGFDQSVAALALLWPDYRPSEPLGALDVYARLGGTPERPRLEDLQGSLGPVTVAGAVGLSFAGPRPRLEADLRTTALELGRFRPAPERSSPARRPGPGTWSRLPLDLDALGRWDGRLALTASALSSGELRIERPSLRLSLEDGTLTLGRLTGRAFGGDLGLSGRLTADQPPRLAAELELAGAAVAPVLDSLLDAAPAHGTLDLSFSVESAGASEAALVSGLSGTGLVALRDGAVEGLDLAAVADGLAELDEPLAFLEVLRQALSHGTTEVAALNMPLEIRQGVARSENLRLFAPEALGEGELELDLGSGRLEATIAFDLHAVHEAPPFGLRLFGPVERPSRTLQAEALQAFLARRAAEALSDRLGPEATPDPRRPSAGSPTPGAGAADEDLEL